MLLYPRKELLFLLQLIDGAVCPTQIWIPVMVIPLLEGLLSVTAMPTRILVNMITKLIDFMKIQGHGSSIPSILSNFYQNTLFFSRMSLPIWPFSRWAKEGRRPQCKYREFYHPRVYFPGRRYFRFRQGYYR